VPKLAWQRPRTLARPSLLIGLALALALTGCAIESRVLQKYGLEERQPPIPPASYRATEDLGEGAPTSDGSISPGLTTEQLEPRVELGADGRAQFFRGTGQMVMPPRTGTANVVEDGDGGVTLNFSDARIEEVIHSILGGVLNLNYVIDPRVKGKVTMRTRRPLQRDAVLSAFETVLQLNDAALVKEGDMYKVVIAKGAGTGNPNVSVRRVGLTTDAGVGTTIVPLAFVSAAEMKKILAPIAEEQSIVYSDPRRNLLVLSGRQSEIDAMINMIEAFDVDWLAGTSFGLFRLEFVDAKTMVDELSSVLFSARDQPADEAVRLIPIARLNAVIAISPNRTYIGHVRRWVERLDVPGDTVEQRIFLYTVQNGRATDLANVLNSFFIAEAEKPEPVAPSRRPAEISTRAAPPAAESAAADGGQAAPAAATAPAPNLEVAPRLNGSDEGASISSGAQVRIVADDKRNALLISATTRDYRNILKLLRQLDAPPLQVLIEATIAEVTLRDNLQYGLQWFFRKSKHEFTLSEVASGVIAPTFPGFSYIFSAPNMSIALDALTDMTDVRVISSPQIMIMNNEPARLQVGDQVPIPIQSAVGVTDPDSPIVNTIQFRDTGVILQVTPRVNESGMVILEINQEVSDAAPTTTSGIDAPTIQQRRVSSVVAVESGQTLALGGIIRTTRSVTKSGLPFLSEIPVLGALFGSTSRSEDRTELLILLMPRVVRSTKEMIAVSQELRRRLREVEPLTRHLP